MYTCLLHLFSDIALTEGIPLDGCSDEYVPCSDGSKCIREDNLCDQINDCRDGSDEDGCDLFIKCEGYDKTIPKFNICDGKFDCQMEVMNLIVVRALVTNIVVLNMNLNA